MSNWTHVAGIVRIDDLRGIMDAPDFDKIFGKECLFDSPSAVWRDYDEHPDDYLPMGWEGSLQKSIWVNPEKDCAAAYTVSIFGDLRDHHNPMEIIDWFKQICTSDDLWIRNACIVADNELNGVASWHYEHEKL